MAGTNINEASPKAKNEKGECVKVGVDSNIVHSLNHTSAQDSVQTMPSQPGAEMIGKFTWVPFSDADKNILQLGSDITPTPPPHFSSRRITTDNDAAVLM